MKRAPLIVSISLSALISGTAGFAIAHAQEGREEAPAPSRDGDAAAEVLDEVAADADVVEEGGSKVKVFRFTGLDISGRLKSPQLLYFLNRLRAEFDRPKLPHRSFMPELVRSTKAKGM